MNFRRQWRAFQRGRPGRRFTEHYERARRAGKGNGALGRIVLLLLGLVALAIALVLSVFPGPAILFFLIAGALLAVQSRALSRLMDWLEVRLRRIARRAAGIWRRFPVAAKAGLLIAAAAVSATMAWIGYRWLS